MKRLLLQDVTMPRPIIRSSGIVDVSFGEAVTVIEPVNLYGCRIGDHSLVGPFVEIQSGAEIGQRCRVQSHSFICDGVTIGDDCFIGHGVAFINDDFREGGPAKGDTAKWRTTKIGSRVAIGSNATLLPVFVVDDVVIGAGAVVVNDIREAGTYAGNPARLIKRHTHKS